MSDSFRGFPEEGMKFLRQLKKNNDREWFTPRKAVYEEQVRMPMLALIRALHGEMMEFAPGYVGDPKKCIFRIYRDTRFSKDKTPYKTNIAAHFRRNSLGKGEGGGFYFSVSPEGVEIGGGIYAPDPQMALIVRRHIEAKHEAFRKTFETPQVKKLLGGMWGEQMARAPKGFDPEHPAIDLIRHKHFVLFSEQEGALAASPKLQGEIVRRFRAIAPFIEFLNGAFGRAGGSAGGAERPSDRTARPSPRNARA
jgi:uncharacterized protein (TIGR02453 family)